MADYRKEFKYIYTKRNMSKGSMETILGGTKFKIIDLSHPLDLDLEVYPGDPKLEREVFSDVVETGYGHLTHTVGDHMGHPHGDAPSHQNPELKDKGIEHWYMNYFFNNAILIDLSSTREAQEFDGIRYLVEVNKEHLEKFNERLSQVGAVVIRTGYDKWLEDNREHTPENIPYLSKEAAEYIASFDNINVVGVDSLTIDPIGKHDAHWLLTKDKFVVESLVNLDQIPSEDRLNFDLQTSPFRIKGATGSPVVAHAFVKR
jgi:kynurenine formamidase